MSTTYSIKEIFYSIQGEGYHAGTPSVFVRFAGCNLWNGEESKREKWFQQTQSPCARFCDTDFRKGKKMTAIEITDEVAHLGRGCKRIVLTGGEPTLQFDLELRGALQDRGYFLSMETNGTNGFGAHPDWVTLSPKVDGMSLPFADELKVIYPAVDPLRFETLLMDRFTKGTIDCRFFRNPGRKFLQPEDGPHAKRNIQKCLDFILAHPDWRLSLQTHKIVGLR